MPKTPIVGTPGRGICSMHSFYTIPIVLSSTFITVIGSERRPCDVFSHGETIHFRSVEFIIN
jgi:hypothetical protein